MKRLFVFISFLVLTGASLIIFHPTEAKTVAATQAIEFSGWLPYWKVASSTADVAPHLSQLAEINPFGYTVKQNGTLYDAAGISTGTTSAQWQTLFTAARAKGTRIVPTVMWSDTNNIDRILRDPALRTSHIQALVQMVNQNNFAGVDIDYEGKKVETYAPFAQFLKELKQSLGTKELSCTIEARTPPDSLNTTVRVSDIQYANDFSAINTYCDRVVLMTYDQQSIDKKLNAAAVGANALYTPVSDPAWVSKVVTLAAQTISKNKLVLGVATYGYEYNVSTSGGRYSYKLLNSVTQTYATSLAQSLSIAPARASYGEMNFTYQATTTPVLKNTVTLPKGTTSAYLVAVRDRLQAQALATTTSFRYVVWSDSTAIAKDIALAKTLGIRGVAIFKLDGGEDQTLWNYLPSR